ncbi:hypothetical protein KVT40_008248 [Elsinoe batatas]|uniref:Uncharacterized protein n=1 Tax=Elsinoe batatas TaxID=2601811 RepID=A0A8K0KU72_9PEZI|nr:hypothetical protein KVT40_008248 [Elsinoe batatas]
MDQCPLPQYEHLVDLYSYKTSRMAYLRQARNPSHQQSHSPILKTTSQRSTPLINTFPAPIKQNPTMRFSDLFIPIFLLAAPALAGGPAANDCAGTDCTSNSKPDQAPPNPIIPPEVPVAPGVAPSDVMGYSDASCAGTPENCDGGRKDTLPVQQQFKRSVLGRRWVRPADARVLAPAKLLLQRWHASHISSTAMTTPPLFDP